MDKPSYIAVGTDPNAPARLECASLEDALFFALGEVEPGYPVRIYFDPSGEGVTNETTFLRVIVKPWANRRC